MTCEIPLCVVRPLRQIHVGHRLAMLISCNSQNVGDWIRVGRVPEAHWQDFMANAVALLEVQKTLKPLRRSAEYRSYHARWARKWRAKLSLGERRRWQQRHNEWRRARHPARVLLKALRVDEHEGKDLDYEFR